MHMTGFITLLEMIFKTELQVTEAGAPAALVRKQKGSFINV